MATRLEIEVGGAAGEKWSAIMLNAAGEPVYASNGGKIGKGIRVMRVSESAAVNTAPVGPAVNPINFTVKP